MKRHFVSLLLLILTVRSGCSEPDRFFISAPNIFHVGVKEKVYVQVEGCDPNHPIAIYLEQEMGGQLMSNKETVRCDSEQNIKMVEIKINMTDTFKSYLASTLQEQKIPYLNLVAESSSFSNRERKTSRVLVSKHRGYIFIQTDQPMYTPTQTVKYRIFTLDHTLRPNEEGFQISIYTAAGNRIMKTLKSAKGGILSDTFALPDVPKMGTWKITAHYENDENNAAVREFKVQKFVLPSFEVNIDVTPNYILLNSKQFVFSVSAKYTHGEIVKGSYHCRFGVAKKGRSSGEKMTIDFIRGLELTGSLNIDDGRAELSQSINDINKALQKEHNQILDDLHQSGAQLLVGVFVTNIQSGEMQEAEVYLPIFAHKYTIDLSRTRSHFVPGYPIDAVVFVRNSDGSAAAGVSVQVAIVDSSEGSVQDRTDQEGAVFHTLNNDRSNLNQITLEVTVDNDLREQKKIKRVSPSNNHLYISFTSKLYSVNDLLTVTFNTNGQGNGNIYYMVLSRGVIIQNKDLPFGSSVKHNLHITHDMVPSFRLIGYFYNSDGSVTADSIWVDVRDECEIKVEVNQKGPVSPGSRSELEFNLHGQRAKVALLAVDKAFYALNADNKLTSQEVFSAMQSYDLGCSYGGGLTSESTLVDAGLAFISSGSKIGWKQGFGCNPQTTRQRRSVDLDQELKILQSNLTDDTLKDCCSHGFTTIPMTLTCEERALRVARVKRDQTCADVFLKCCLKGQHLLQKKMQEDAEKGLGRTASALDIEKFFLDSSLQYIRRYFPPSFAFKQFEVNGQARHSLALPDSITTWEIQAIALSPTRGFCVVKPTELRASKRIFVSLKLPYSVKRYEQISISPVIYNYGTEPLEAAVHMEQTEGLCSPGSATTTAFVNITVKEDSSQFVTFSAVPMRTGSIPIKIRVFDIENEWGVDAIEKTLNVKTEGLEEREEQSKLIKLDGRSTATLFIDGTLPDEIVPDSNTNIFVSMEGNEFSSQVKTILSPDAVFKLVVKPSGCCEQTMSRFAPTALALRYLDLSDQWFHLPPGARDDALRKVEEGYTRILTKFKKPNGAYSPWYTERPSIWLTGYVLKVLSLVAERQRAIRESQITQEIPVEAIRESVNYLVSVQNNDGSFTDPNPVLHRHVLEGKDHDASITAFVTAALHLSLQFLGTDMRNNVEASIMSSTIYLTSQLEDLQHPYAVALTAYCLSVCTPEGTDISTAWTKLEELAVEGNNGCYLWTTDTSPGNKERANAITIETTGYALLTAVALQKTEWADRAACWLVTQENYFGGFKSTQDTIVAVEAITEYELKRTARPETNVIAEFSTEGKRDIMRLTLERNQKVETDLKKFRGSNIIAQLSGQGEAKIKIVKAYHRLDPKDDCKKLSISVTVEGKVRYTAKVIENYEYYDDYDDVEKGSHSRSRRDVNNELVSDEDVTYTVCVSHSLNENLTGMAIADITLLSGFEPNKEDLDRLREPPEQYISHYEVSYGRVVIYFNELYEERECIRFSARQTVPVGLLQPAPAVFYDYYEPDRKCTVFYSAPKRSKVVSKLCSEDVCQCAERPCHKLKMTFKLENGRRLTKNNRVEHACFFPTVDYAYIVEVLNVSMKSNFQLYKTNVIDALRANGDIHVGKNSERVFAKRRQCKGDLEIGKQYLIMGKDGTTTDSNKAMQYLLELTTWVEKKPLPEDCTKSAHKAACRGFNGFLDEYRLHGCKQ